MNVGEEQIKTDLSYQIDIFLSDMIVSRDIKLEMGGVIMLNIKKYMLQV